MPLNIGNLTDDQAEKLIAFARDVARLQLYGDELPYEDHHGEDAMETCNHLIEQARSLLD